MNHLRPSISQSPTVRQIVAVLFCLGTCAPLMSAAAEPGWISLFDGTSLGGWHVSAKTGHSGTSKNTSGGRWVVEDLGSTNGTWIDKARITAPTVVPTRSPSVMTRVVGAPRLAFGT
ncbi:MAG: FHA domain-containing protein, partial [Planctomycetota bacterium]